MPSLPHQSSITCTATPARARSASASANSRPIVPDQKIWVSKVIECRAPRIASNMAAKMRSPLTSASTRLPSRIGGPSSEAMTRWNCGSATEYAVRMRSSICLLPSVRFINASQASVVATKVPTALAMPTPAFMAGAPVRSPDGSARRATPQAGQSTPGPNPARSRSGSPGSYFPGSNGTASSMACGHPRECRQGKEKTYVATTQRGEHRRTVVGVIRSPRPLELKRL